MKKGWRLVALTGIFAVWMAAETLAGQWVSDETGKWWQNEDGSWYTDGWQWLDTDGDGVSECYYFDTDGYLLTDTETPDGYQVNANGAWIVDGAVQSQGSATQFAGVDTQTTEENSSGKYKDDYSGMYILPAPDGDIRCLTIAYNEATNSISVSFGHDSDRYVYWGVSNGLTYFDLDSDEDNASVAFSAPGVVRWKNYDGVWLYVERE